MSMLIASMDALLAWATGHGGNLHAIQWQKRSMFAAADVPPGTTLISLPIRLLVAPLAHPTPYRSPRTFCFMST